MNISKFSEIKIYILVIISLLSELIFSYENKKVGKALIFYAENVQFLLPFIEYTLSNLRYQGTDSLIFNSVTNLNRYEDNIKDEITRREIIDYYSGKYLTLSEKAKKVQEAIAKELLTNNSFLKIKINTLNQLLEYQFVLYQTIPTKEHEFTISDIKRPDKAISIFINPNSHDYLSILENAIKQIFPESNIPPTAIISVNGIKNDSRKKYYFAIGDTIVLDASESIDIDTSRDHFTYKWRQIDELSKINVPIDKLVTIDHKMPRQLVVINKKDTYLFGLKVSDGIVNSLEDTLRIGIIDRPLIYVNEENINIYRYRQETIFNFISNFKRSQFETVEGNLNIAISNFERNDVELRIIPIDKFREINLTKFDSLRIIASQMETDQNIFPKKAGKSDALGSSPIIFSKKRISGGYKVDFSGKLKPREYIYEVYSEENGVKSNPIKISIEYITRSFLIQGQALRLINISSSDTSKTYIKEPLSIALASMYTRIYLLEVLALEISYDIPLSSSNEIFFGGLPNLIKLKYNSVGRLLSYSLGIYSFRTHLEGEQLQLEIGYDAEIIRWRTFYIEFGVLLSFPLQKNSLYSSSIFTLGTGIDFFAFFYR